MKKINILLIIINSIIFLGCKKETPVVNNIQETTNLLTDTIIPTLEQKYNKYDSESFGNSILDSEGNIIIVGTTNNYTKSDIFVLKINNLGDTIWTTIISDSIKIKGSSITETYDNKYIVTGYTQSLAPNGKGIIVARLNNNGLIDWQKNYTNWISANGRNKITKKTDGTYLIAGEKLNSDESRDLYLLKINDNGDSLTSQIIALTNNLACYSVISTNNVGYALIVNSGQYLNDSQEILLIKLNDDLMLEWEKEYSFGMNSYSYSLVQDNNNNYYITGYIYEPDITKGLLFKTDADGNKLWEKSYEYENAWNVLGKDILKTIDNNLLLTMQVEGDFINGTLLIKLDQEGNNIWRKYIDHYQSQQSIETSSNNISILGYTMYNSIDSYDIFYCKLP